MIECEYVRTVTTLWLNSFQISRNGVKLSRECNSLSAVLVPGGTALQYLTFYEDISPNLETSNVQ